jgi:hypothetical protein
VLYAIVVHYTTYVCVQLLCTVIIFVGAGIATTIQNYIELCTAAQVCAYKTLSLQILAYKSFLPKDPKHTTILRIGPIVPRTVHSLQLGLYWCQNILPYVENNLVVMTHY